MSDSTIRLAVGALARHEAIVVGEDVGGEMGGEVGAEEGKRGEGVT